MEAEIKSLTKAFNIIAYLSECTSPVSLSAIAANCSLPTSTAHRILNSLVSLGYVKGDKYGQYCLSLKLFELSSRVATSNRVVSIVKPHLEDLSIALNISAHLVVRDGLGIVHLFNVAKPTGQIQLSARIGNRVEMYCTAVGKAILSTLPDEEIRKVLSQVDLAQRGPNTITDPEALLCNIQAVRTCGYAIDDEENEESIRCIGVPLANLGGDATYAFSVSSLAPHMTDDKISHIAQAMLSTKEAILADLF